MLRIASFTALAALVLAAVPVASAEAVAPRECYEYMYVADYHWYWVCVNPKDASCPVYWKEQHGVTVRKECVVELNAADSGSVAPEGACYPTSGGLDYQSHLCYNPKDLRCPVYTLSHTDWGTTKTCIPSLS